MDRGPCENELKQCLGETRFAYDISEEDVIIFGVLLPLQASALTALRVR